MSKGDETREYILAQTASLFSQQGFSGTSMSDVMRVTGLEKGGIYNHFRSKEQLALEAYEYAAGKVGERMSAMVYAHKHAADRLLAMVDAMALVLFDPVLPGGCPTMNAAIESDDTNPTMQEKAARTLNAWVHMIHRITEKGIERGELQPQVDISTLASLIIATLEGALMMSKACNDPAHMARTSAFLKQYINQEIRVS